MICPICKQERDTLRSAVKDGEYISERCDKCHASFKGFSDGSRAFLREWDVREHARSLIQPWEKDYIREYGPEKASEAGWSDDAIRRYT